MHIHHTELTYHQFIKDLAVHQRQVNYDSLTPKVKYDDRGNIIPHRPQKIKLTFAEVFSLLGPYLWVRVAEQLRAVLPLTFYLVLFQMIVLRTPIHHEVILVVGIFCVIIGLTLFMEGLKLGLMPFSETIGVNLPKKLALQYVLCVAFILGVGATFAEPAIGALQAVGSIIKVEEAPYLYGMLNIWTSYLLMAVGLGVGVAAVLGSLRLIYGWSLKPLIYCTTIPALLLSFYCFQDPNLNSIIGLAWDCGGITTGPVTVPLVLALGIGLSSNSVDGSSGNSLSGFGIVTLASIVPVLFVLILGLVLSQIFSVQDAILLAEKSHNVADIVHKNWWDYSPFIEMKVSFQAIIPLVLFLFFVMIFILKERIKQPKILGFGLLICLLGMMVFNIGLTYGLSQLGNEAGSLLPASFQHLEAVKASPFYKPLIGIIVALVFAFVLGYGATIAEPALNAMGITVQNITNGAFRKKLLILCVAIGVGCGLSVGVAKIIYDLPLFWILMSLYIVVLVMTYFASEEFVNVAWDSAGVTTGPVTVPLVLALGVGLGVAVYAKEGFGILATASVMPILSVLFMGLLLEIKKKLN